MDRLLLLYELLGSGRIGTVFRGADRSNGQGVVPKRDTGPAAQLNFASCSVDRNLTPALAHEFRTLAALGPHIISDLECGFDEQR